MNVGKSLRLALMYNGYTQTKMANDLKMTRAAISVHANKEYASNPVIKRFADYFGMSVKEFIELGE